MQFDHIAISCDKLEVGARYVEERLGVVLGPHGRHAHFGTHNRLMSLGPGQYLEVIAPDPDAPRPDRPRWFGLDNPPGQPCVGNWIARVDDLERAIAAAPEPIGQAVDLERNGLTWRIAVPPDGSLPLDEGWPTLIQWTTPRHPAAMLEDVGVRLISIAVHHPRADWLRQSGAGDVGGVEVSFHRAPAAKLNATFSTPSGRVVL